MKKILIIFSIINFNNFAQGSVNEKIISSLKRTSNLSFDFEIAPEYGFHIQGAGEPVSQEHNFLIFQEDQPFMITMEDSDLPISLRG